MLTKDPSQIAALTVNEAKQLQIIQSKDLEMRTEILEMYVQ
jgi:hypothetical protein